MAKDLVSNIYLFKGLPADEIAIIAKVAVEENFHQGQVIFSQGDKADALYIVRYGTVKISHSSPHGEEIEVASLGNGSHFGEMGFLDGHKRTGTAVAIETCQIVSLSYKKLAVVFDHNPKLAAHFYRAIALFLCNSLENTTRDLTFAREKNLKAA